MPAQQQDDDQQKLYLSKPRTTILTTPSAPSVATPAITAPSRGSHKSSKTRKSSSRKSSKIQLADGDSRETSNNSRRSSKRTSNVELSPGNKSPNSSRRSSRKLQLADGNESHSRRSKRTSSSSEKPSRKSSSRHSSSRRSSNRRHRQDDDSSSEDAPGAFPVDSLNPQSANSTASHTITSRESDMMIAAEISPDREMEVRQAYEQGAQDMRTALQQQNNMRVQELEESENNVIVAVAQEDEETKQRFSKATICGCFVFCILALAGAIVGSIFGIRRTDPKIIVLDKGPKGPMLQECESVVNETGLVDPNFVESTSMYLDMAVIQEADSGMSESELENLKQRILLYILTVLLGCDEDDIQTLEQEILGIQSDARLRWLQEEDIVGASSNTTSIFQDYVVGNTFISDIRVWESNEACLQYFAEQGNNCTHVRLVLEIDLSEEITQEELLDAVTTEFQREPLVPRLKLDLMESNPYVLIQVVDIDYIASLEDEPSDSLGNTTSSVPTIEPSPPVLADFSSTPSSSPSFAPSTSSPGSGNNDNGGTPKEPIVTPEPTTLAPTTPNPTLAPVVGPSPNPTPSPTDLPSLPPSPPPTVLPTQFPTKRPTPGPTPNPTPNPTPGPSPNPTTPPPTAAPSPSPSAAPSVSPSSAPSLVPSEFPTQIPSVYPSAGPSACPVPSCSGPNTCTGFTAAMTIHPCGSCSVDQDCSYSGSMQIGRGSCNGKEECNAGYGNVIGDNSCNGNDATWDGTSSTRTCAYLHSVTIGDNSCNCAECCACLDYGVNILDNQCNTPGECCTVFGGTQSVGTGSCADSSSSRTWSCVGSKGIIGMNSCTGAGACKNQRDFIGDGSCNGVQACGYHSGNIGDFSCLGFKACQGGWDANIGDGSCNGIDACVTRNNINIGNGSCNCQACCACLPDGVDVPDGSCNVRAASPGDIDFVSGVGGTRCCYFAALPP